MEPRHTVEGIRLAQDATRERNWKRWGPYLAARQWSTVREDYSATGDTWEYFSHEAARSRAFRWGEDGLLGIADRECRLCFALALWNGRDRILKERLFGLTGFGPTGSQGNHGEDVKECYYYLDSTPTHSYMRALYKYPQRAFPYELLAAENRRRGLTDPEYELADTGVFDDQRYFDVTVEYAKAGTDDMLIRVTVQNRGPTAAMLDLLPTLWFRNTWSWGREGGDYPSKPMIRRGPGSCVVADHPTLGRFTLVAGSHPARSGPRFLFTDNETNAARLFGSPNRSAYVKDAFHEHIVHGAPQVVNPEQVGTKAAVHYELRVPPGGAASVELRLTEGAAEGALQPALGDDFAAVFSDRQREADEFYDTIIPPAATDEERIVIRQAYAGLLWSKQFFNYVVRDWLAGDPGHPAPPAQRHTGRNSDWRHVHCRDVISMPDKWEYPWFAAWDLAFHMIAFARIDPQFAKEQLLLFLREWYMHPNGQLPAYEFALGDVNPPVHAWACWRVYKMTGPRGQRDRVFLARAFQKLLINFTWWVNRKDTEGNHLFSGGFLGLDNIGVFDRSRPVPTGGRLEQADGTAWMAFYAATMMSMALELAKEDPAYEDVASKFLEHFVAIADAMNTLGGGGLWDEEDGFYYDRLHVGTMQTPLRVRSLVGVIPLFAGEVLEDALIEKLPGFRKRLLWFLENRQDLARHISYMEKPSGDGSGTSHSHRLLAIPSRERLERVLRYVLDESEFLSAYGVRSLSRVHKDRPYVLRAGAHEYRVNYVSGESDSYLFGGNSNWRGPVWLPLNYLLIEALERYDHFYGGNIRVECPRGSGRLFTLAEVARELDRRLASLFLPDSRGKRAGNGDDPRYASDPAWRDLVLFHEYFDGDTGRGLGASHQGWTALATLCIERLAAERGHQVLEKPWRLSSTGVVVRVE